MHLDPMTVTYGDILPGDIITDSAVPKMFGKKVLRITRAGESVGLSLTRSSGLASCASSRLSILRMVND